MRSYLILSMCILYLVQYFVQFQWLQYGVVILALAAFIASILNASRLPGIIAILMMGVGITVELFKGTGFAGISEGIFLVLPLLSLITLAPLLSIPLKISGFFKSISSVTPSLPASAQKNVCRNHWDPFLSQSHIKFSICQNY